MRLLTLADTHFDAWFARDGDPLAPIARRLDDLDAVIILGDLCGDPERNWAAVFAHLSMMMDPAKIWVLPGNHDYYGFRLDGDARLREIAEAAGANFLQKTALVLGGVRFLCCTLWSDFRLLGDQAAGMRAAAEAMNDYDEIRTSAGGPLITPEDTVAVFRDHLAWLTAEIGKPFPGPTAVLTHHAPSPSVAGKLDRISPAYGSDLDAWIREHGPDLWLFGHTHRRLSATIGPTLIRNVSVGTRKEVEWFRHEEVLLSFVLDTEDLLRRTVIGGY